MTNLDPATMITVNHYSADAKTIIRTSEHPTRRAAEEAIRRWEKKGEIVAIAQVRTVDDPPTTHHL